MSEIIVNTDVLNNASDELLNIAKYYKDKKFTFNSSNFNVANIYNLNNYCNKVIKIYEDLDHNITNVANLLKNYVEDVESLERQMTGQNGYIKIPEVQNLVNEYHNVIKLVPLETGNLFEIKYLNKDTATSRYNYVPIENKIPATIITCGLSFLEGITNFGEMLVDGGAMAVAAGSTLATNVTNFLGLDGVTEILNGASNAIGEFVEEDWSKEGYYKLMDITGLDEYADPNSTAANIASIGGNIVAGVVVALLTGGASAAAFGTGSATAATVSGIATGVTGALTNAGIEGEMALKRGASMAEAEAVAGIASMIGWVAGNISGKINMAAREIGRGMGINGIGAIAKYSLASFGINSSEQVIDEIAHTLLYDHDENVDYFKSFFDNASKYGLGFQMLFSGAAGGFGTLVNGIKGIQALRNYNKLKDSIVSLLAVANQDNPQTIRLRHLSDIDPEIFEIIKDNKYIKFEINGKVLTASALKSEYIKVFGNKFEIDKVLADMTNDFPIDLPKEVKNRIEVNLNNIKNKELINYLSSLDTSELKYAISYLIGNNAESFCLNLSYFENKCDPAVLEEIIDSIGSKDSCRLIMSGNFSSNVKNLLLKNISTDSIGELIKNHFLLYSSDLDDSIKSEFYHTLSSSTKYFEQFNARGSFFGADQNATRKFVTFELTDRAWLDDFDGFMKFMQEKYPKYSYDDLLRIFDVRDKKNINFTLYDDILSYLQRKYDGDLATYMNVVNNSFKRTNNSLYEPLLEKMLNLGLDRQTAVAVLDKVDTDGICSYAALANCIFDKYRGNADMFKSQFGFDMYTTLPTGKRILNSSELLMDMYVAFNSDSPSSIFKIENGKIIGVDLTASEDSLFGTAGYRGPDIKKYLINKGIVVNFEKATYLPKPKFFGNFSSHMDIEDVKKIFIDSLQESQVILGLYPTNRKGFHMNYWDDTLYTVFDNTDSGHGVYVTGITDTSVIVSSWGKELFIPLDDFIDNVFDIRKAIID